MSIRLRHLTTVSLVALTLSCGSEGATAPRGTRPTVSSPPVPTLVSLAIVPDTIVMALGAGLSLSFVEVWSNGARVPVRANFFAANYDIVAINPANHYVSAIGPGRSTITALLDGLVAVAPVVVLDPKSIGPSDALVVERFSVTAHLYESAANQWLYAPQLRVRASPGRAVSVLFMTFTIPGIGDAPGWGCAATISSTARELNGEVYGDWAFEIGPAGQPSDSEATATVRYLDDAGTMATRTVRGPVVRGSGPMTYGGDPGACFHGYGSTAVRRPGD